MSTSSRGHGRGGCAHADFGLPFSIGTLSFACLFAALLGGGCNIGGGGGNTNGNISANDNVISPGETVSQDITIDSLTLNEGETITVTNGAVITVTGDATINGTMESTNGPVTLIVHGATAIGGAIRSVQDAPTDTDDTAPLSDQPTGIFIIVGDEGVDMSAEAVLETDGHTIITDDPGLLDSTPEELANQLEDVAGDDLPTLVPLPPESDAFQETTSARGGRMSTKPALTLQDAPLGPIVVSGTWPPDGAAPPITDRPIVILRFNGPREVFIVDWQVNGPPAPAGAPNDQSNTPGNDATGANGRNGLTLNIRNDGGPINVQGDVTLNLAAGGDGATATAVCASATGGNGGQPGNFRMTGSEGIDLSLANLTIVPGRGGNGGAAIVHAGAPGASGCDGEDGGDATAQGGRGADNRKALFARGNVEGVENVTIAAVAAGNGGDATATACDGGDGDECCSAGFGGEATATGGRGGDASLDVKGLPVTVGDVVGGNGGEATATGGNGGVGGDCKLDDGGDGGDGGDATATGGAGGSATGGTAIGGNGGDATATGGDGGDSGGSALGDPGFEGFGGFGTATGGAGGTPGGATGTPLEEDGNDGVEGPQLDLILYCFTFAFIDYVNGGVIAPGAYDAPVVDPNTDQIAGSVPIKFLEQSGAEYFRGLDPDHIGLQAGTLEIDVSALEGVTLDPGHLAGIQITPLYGTGIDNKNPLRVEARDANDFVVGNRLITNVPDNQGNLENPDTVDAIFTTDSTIAVIRIVVPVGAFVTIVEICLIDP